MQPFIFIQGGLTPAEALDRYWRFIDTKRDSIARGIQIYADDYLSCKAKDFLEMLKEIALLPGSPSPRVNRNLTGIKVYFICHDSSIDHDHTPPGKHHQIGFVFVPTIQTVSSDIGDRHQTDDDYFCLIKRGSSFKIKKAVAGSLAQKYVGTAHRNLPASDTKCLWYEIAQVVTIIARLDKILTPQGGNPPPDPDVVFAFGAYKPIERIDTTSIGEPDGMEINGQLTMSMIFGEEQEIVDWLHIRPSPIMQFIRKALKSGPGDDDIFDTGIPIPPAGGGGENTLP